MFADESVEFLTDFELEIDIREIFDMLRSGRTDIGRQVSGAEKHLRDYISVQLLYLCIDSVDLRAALFVILFTQLVFFGDKDEVAVTIIALHLHRVGNDFSILVRITISTLITFISMVVTAFRNFFVKLFAKLVHTCL